MNDRIDGAFSFQFVLDKETYHGRFVHQSSFFIIICCMLDFVCVKFCFSFFIENQSKSILYRSFGIVWDR